VRENVRAERQLIVAIHRRVACPKCRTRALVICVRIGVRAVVLCVSMIWAYSEKGQERGCGQAVRTEVGVVLYARGRARSRGIVRACAAVGRVGCIARQKCTRQIDIRCVWESRNGGTGGKTTEQLEGEGGWGRTHLDCLDWLNKRSCTRPGPRSSPAGR